MCENNYMVDRYRFLVRSLAYVALSYEEQQNIFPKNSDILDEVISDFNDSFLFIYHLMDINRLSYKAVAKILHCHTLIELNLSMEERITNSAFANDDSWMQIRCLAKEALIELCEFDWRKTLNSSLIL